MKLYKVYTKSYSAYVMAEDLNDAWGKFKAFLDAGDGYGFASDREFRKIELVADSEVHNLPDNISNFQERLFM